MGAVFRVKMHYVDLPALFKNVLALEGKVYGTFLDGKNIYELTSMSIVQIKDFIENLKMTDYGQYLLSLVGGND